MIYIAKSNIHVSPNELVRAGEAITPDMCVSPEAFNQLLEQGHLQVIEPPKVKPKVEPVSSTKVEPKVEPVSSTKVEPKVEPVGSTKVEPKV